MNIGEADKSEEMSTIGDINTDGLTTQALDIAYDEAQKKLLVFVTENIKVMQAHLLKDRFSSFDELRKAYIDYVPTSLELNRLYQRVKMDAKRAADELEAFDDQAMDSTKRELNRDDNKKTWFSPTELRAAAHTKYKNKYAQLNARVALAEGRRSFVERLCKTWDSWNFSLNQLSANLRAEANANGLDMQSQNYMAADPDDHGSEGILAAALNGD